MDATGKLRLLVEELNKSPLYWTDNVPFWQARANLVITAGDVREWLSLIQKEAINDIH